MDREEQARDFADKLTLLTEDNLTALLLAAQALIAEAHKEDPDSSGSASDITE